MTIHLDSCMMANGIAPTRQNGRLAHRDGLAPSLSEAKELAAFGQLCGRSAPMLELYRHIQRVAPTQATVLIAGETGTGKEVVARTIHELSTRRNEAFVALNCGAISAALIDSELFGHEQGSFTGANRMHNGVFAQADKGTLFLDEITEMSLDLQVRLLRVLETGLFNRVGGEKQLQVDTRVIAAANLAPEQAVRDGKLREDLFYRLRMFPLSLPPLRDRDSDVELLANHFLDVLNRQASTNKHFSAEARQRLKAHSWPGNVRELKHLVQQEFILADREIDAESLQSHQEPPDASDRIEVRIGSSIAAAEKQLVLATMDWFRGDKKKVAQILGISVKTLYSRLSVYAAGGSTNGPTASRTSSSGAAIRSQL